VPPTTERYGYIFAGWNPAGEYNDVTGDMTITAQWELIVVPGPWTVTFNLNGGELVDGELTQTVAHNDNAVPPVVERYGYTFLGWSPAGDYNNVTGDMTITAQWKPDIGPQPYIWTVTFDLNGGVLVSGELEQEVPHEGSATPPTVERYGYIFAGWNPVGRYNNVTGDMTITAQWESIVVPGPWTVTFNLNGGELVDGELTQTVAHNANAAPPTVERYGYTFVNWNPAGGYNNVVGDITITATWERDEVTIPTLSSPTDLAILLGHALSWNAVTDAVGYRVYVNGIAQTTTIMTTSFDLRTLRLSTGTHQIQVRALGDGIATLDSSLSGIVNFVIQPPATQWGGNGNGEANVYLPTLTPPLAPAPPHAPTPPAIMPEMPSFEDIGYNDWFFGYIFSAITAGLFRGVSDTHFAPNYDMTRAMFVQVLVNYVQADLTDFYNIEPTFYDVQQGAWYFAAVEWAASQGLVLGVGQGNFAPNAPATREQIATMVHRFLEFVEVELPRVQTVAFVDQSDISYWAVDAVEAAQAKGLIGGFPGGMFAPQEIASRVEVAAIFVRLLRAI